MNPIIILVILDILWVSTIMYNPFKGLIENVQKEPMKVKNAGTVVAYIFLSILATVILPKLDETEAFLLGLCVYGVYDSTNYATLERWDLKVATLDTMWGGILFWCVWKCSQW